MFFKRWRTPRNSRMTPDGVIVHYGGDALYLDEQEAEVYTRIYGSDGERLDGTEWTMIEDENMRENRLEKHFYDSVKAAGGWPTKLMPTQKGVPDRMVLYNGAVYLIELKTDAGEPSEIQKWWHRNAAKFGIRVPVLYDKADIDRWIEEELK